MNYLHENKTCFGYWSTISNIQSIKCGLYLLLCTMVLTGCKSCKDKPDGPNPIDQVVQVHWELVPETVQCGSGLQPFSNCLVPLQLVFTWKGGFVDYRGFSCCLDCERGVPAGQLGLQVVEFATGNTPLSPRVRIPEHKARPGMIIWTQAGGIHDNVIRDWCANFQSSDLEGSNLLELVSFLNQLTLRYGQEYDLDPKSNNPKDICLYISEADPPIRTDPSGNTGIVAGEISCASGTAARARNCRYQITLYKNAFYGQCSKKPFNTVAHEFKHILQSIELNLPISTCDQPTSNGSQYEQEANDWANSIITDCSDCQ